MPGFSQRGDTVGSDELPGVGQRVQLRVLDQLLLGGVGAGADESGADQAGGKTTELLAEVGVVHPADLHEHAGRERVVTGDVHQDTEHRLLEGVERDDRLDDVALDRAQVAEVTERLVGAGDGVLVRAPLSASWRTRPRGRAHRLA